VTRPGPVALLGTGLVLALLVFWTMAEPPTAPAPAGGPQTLPASLAALMRNLEVIPLDGTPATAFALETLDGRRLGLADVAGRPALLYFWATW
jgi:hypothetical protein